MESVAPLSFTAIRHWRKECHIPPLSEWEVMALIHLDAAIRHPDEPMVAPAAEVRPTLRAWPTRKSDG